MYCKHCGRLVDDEDVICPSCGYYVNGKKPRNFIEKESDYIKETNSQNEESVENKQQTQNTTTKNDNRTVAILALVFSICCSFFGLVLAVIGLSACKEESNRKLCIIALIISISWVVLEIIFGFFVISEIDESIPEFNY